VLRLGAVCLDLCRRFKAGGAAKEARGPIWRKPSSGLLRNRPSAAGSGVRSGFATAPIGADSRSSSPEQVCLAVGRNQARVRLAWAFAFCASSCFPTPERVLCVQDGATRAPRDRFCFAESSPSQAPKCEAPGAPAVGAPAGSKLKAGERCRPLFRAAKTLTANGMW